MTQNSDNEERDLDSPWIQRSHSCHSFGRNLESASNTHRRSHSETTIPVGHREFYDQLSFDEMREIGFEGTLGPSFSLLEENRDVCLGDISTYFPE
jgi:hypothetical protein